MLITLLASGTRGDTQPFIALGLALQKKGCTVRLAASETFEDLVISQGIEFYPLLGDVSKIAEDENLRKAMSANNPLKVIMGFNTMKNRAYSLQQGFYDACQGSDAIIYHPGAAIGYFIAQTLNIPSILATPFPMIPTKAYPALIFYDSVRLGKAFNLLTHVLFQQILWQMSKASIKRFWKDKFAGIPHNFSNPFSQLQSENRLTLVACSNYVFPKPQDWSKEVHNTGYWFLDEDYRSPPKELQEFLQAGTPPVYVGFGSLGDPTKAVQMTELVIEAIERSGQRGILAKGWNGMTEMTQIPKTIFMVESIPHAWLFPQMSVVVHHGGAGTTAAGLRAGVPSVLIPHSNDQFAWGKKVEELGVGAKYIPKTKLTAENLSAAISFALREEVKAKAIALGRKIQQENGAEVAAKLIINSLKPK